MPAKNMLLFSIYMEFSYQGPPLYIHINGQPQSNPRVAPGGPKLSVCAQASEIKH